MEKQPQEETKAEQKTIQTLEERIADSYARLEKVRVTFNVEGISIANSNKIEYFFTPEQKIMEVKKKWMELTKQTVYFYINKSFMPSLDSALGDLAQSYGNYDQNSKVYNIQLSVNTNEGRYG